ncbi:protein LURP-one-related 8-like [Nicotiana tabacum]|uniref:Protein LURP-one-related 8-like n=2 Tax=Nicotiana TaxID=4085 RepID=A0A1S3XLN4_TOBAC|nr:PREDICTED: protein LURP-one-related 8-like [Nicotiana sylvestris]XP_016440846.1 PREDICTED: protein LURP-one-related 8-like [Nicotiana tabacum]
MSKIHPAADHHRKRSKPCRHDDHEQRQNQNLKLIAPASRLISRPPPAAACAASIFTVWKRSSMSFQGTDGFTVFDKLGQLVFRVDNYTRRKNRSIAAGKGRSGVGGLVLMDANGKPLLTLRPQMRSMQLQYEWKVYSGGEEDENNGNHSPPLFVMRKPPLSLLMMMRTTATNSCQAQVFTADGENDNVSRPDYRVEGSFRRRNCNITNSTGHIVANISRKVANATTRTTVLISDDVFSLVVQPGFEPHIFMAFVIILDRMYPNSYAPLVCS